MKLSQNFINNIEPVVINSDMMNKDGDRSKPVIYDSDMMNKLFIHKSQKFQNVSNYKYLFCDWSNS